MNDEFDSKIDDRELPDEVVEMRAAAEEVRRRSQEALMPVVERRCRAYDAHLAGLALLLQVPLNTSTLDLRAHTRMAALWPLAGRSVGLGQALLSLVAAGYCGEAFPTARSIYEVNRLLIAFAHPEGEPLARQWLEGRTPKPAAVARALGRAQPESGEIAGGVGPAAKLYRALSNAGHGGRDSLDVSISHSLREMVIGPNPDWGMRAYYVTWASGVIWEITFAVGLALGVGFGKAFHAEHVVPMLEQLETIERENPIAEEHLRNAPLEFEAVDE